MRIIVALALAAAAVAAAPARPRLTIVVTSTADSGAGTLRQAIIDSNASVGVGDTITFAFAAAPPNRIALVTALPDIADAVLIDGTSEPDYAGSPVVEVDGSAVGTTAPGFNVTAPNCTIRGLSIYGSTTGVFLANSGATVDGCFIGLGAAGTAKPGTTTGIEMLAGTGTVGGTTAAKRNVIANCSLDGIKVDGGNATILGNSIGTNVAGTAALGSQLRGIRIGNFTLSTVVGGTAAGAGNLISGNTQSGIEDGGFGTLIQGNIIGLNAAGSAAVPNGSGILSSGNTTIGGSAAGARNVISGNTIYGIQLSSSTVSIQGNYIGTNAAGDAAPALQSTGIALTPGSSFVTIGGTAAGAGNLISGNGQGISVSGSNVTIQGNRIGTDAAGTDAVANTGSGITVSGYQVTIGGTAAGAGNLVSGNGELTFGSGIAVNSALGNVTIQGNTVGTNSAGTAAIPNGHGISVNAGGAVLVGAVLGGSGGNLVSGNAHYGIYISMGVTGVQVYANKVGTDAAGTAAIPNVEAGIVAYGSSHAIGGFTAASGNTVSGNGGPGLWLQGDGILVANARVGLASAGLAQVPNIDAGIIAEGSAIRITASVIAGNGFHGVRIGGQDVGVDASSIYDNGGMGIDLDPDGPGVNDVLDTDPGANGQQNTPVLYSAEDDGATTVIRGALHSAPNTLYRIEIYDLVGFTPDPYDHGPGPTLDDSNTLTTDANGDAMFQVTLGASLGVGGLVTATASRDGVCVSEYALNLPVTAPLGTQHIEVKRPTAAPTTAVSDSPVVVGGFAYAAAGISGISWTNAATGGAGTVAAGAEWTASIPLAAGSNLLTFKVTDLTGATATDTLDATFFPVLGDVTAPVVTITTPATAAYETGGNVLFVDGTAADAVGVGTVVWSVAPSGRTGTATGTLSWSAVLPLSNGANTVTIKAYDTSGNLGSSVVTVTVGGGTGGTTTIITDKKSCGLLGIEPLAILALLALRRRRS